MKRAATLLILVCLAAAAHAQTAEPSELSPLDALLSTPISTSAKYDQRMSDVAASVTVITSEEIARYGWRTVADVLESVRGFYTTYDRNYTYLGVRGIGLPTDYNSRFLLLIDGFPMIDAIDGSAMIGSALALDLSSFARIEIIRGPGSVMHGTGAMLGVINLIPKDPSDRSSLTLGAGSRGMQTASARTSVQHGKVAGSVSMMWQETNGGAVDYPDLGGIVRNRDFDDARGILGTLAWKELRVLALHTTRTKGVPTASWETVFGGDEETTDQRTLVGLGFEHQFAPGRRLALRGSFDHFEYAGDYPYDTMWRDHSLSTTFRLDGQYILDLRPNHRVTAGLTESRTARADYHYGNEIERIEARDPFAIHTLYLQSEWQPHRGVALTLGASYDVHPEDDYSHFTPRAALILQPNDRATVKVLYGEGFRLPAVYEELYAAPGAELHEESSATMEVIGEYRLTPDVLATASLFDTRLSDVLRQDPVTSIDYYNGGHVSSRGAELQVDYRRSNGVWGYLSYTWQKAHEDGTPLPNSPASLAKAGLSTSTSRALQGAVELQYASGRGTLDGHTTRDSLLTNLNLSAALTRQLRLSLMVRNAFDVDYATPGGPEHAQDVLQQDGRTFLLRLTLRGGRN